MSDEKPHAVKQAGVLLCAAYNALRSYQHGNSSPDLAGETADVIGEFLGIGPAAGPILPYVHDHILKSKGLL